MATYQEEIAQWRQERARQQIADRCNQIRQEHAQVVRERDEAIANNDLETAEYRDMDCQQLEKEWAEYNPPQQPRNPQWENWIRRNSTFIEREGQRGVKAVTDALAYMQRPRNPNSNDPRYTGNRSAWGESKATERYGGTTRTFPPPKDTHGPQAREDQHGPNYDNDTPNNWLRGANQDATTNPNFDKGKRG